MLLLMVAHMTGQIRSCHDDDVENDDVISPEAMEITC